MLNGRYTVFGRRKGEPEWVEALICDTGNEARYKESVRRAKEAGYEITRIYKPNTNLSAPNFAAAVKV